jgi:hypothetical protein
MGDHPLDASAGPAERRKVVHRTIAISGSRPYANHTARFYRESAALRGSVAYGMNR